MNSTYLTKVNCLSSTGGWGGGWQEDKMQRLEDSLKRSMTETEIVICRLKWRALLLAGEVTQTLAAGGETILRKGDHLRG